MTSWPSLDPAPPVVFLDVDGTLLAETTTFLFAQEMRRRGLLGNGFLIRALYHGLQHRLGHLDYARLVAFGLKNIGGVPVSELERLAYESFAAHVKPRLYAGIVEHILELRRGGTAAVLVSSSPGIVIRPLSLYLGCADMLTTPVKIVGGRLVGIGEGPACYGEGKLYWASRWAAERGVDLGDAAAYADNWSDRWLLAAVGRPVAVNPRRKLARLARSRGWPIVRPSRAAPVG